LFSLEYYQEKISSLFVFFFAGKMASYIEKPSDKNKWNFQFKFPRDGRCWRSFARSVRWV